MFTTTTHRILAASLSLLLAPTLLACPSDDGEPSEGEGAADETGAETDSESGTADDEVGTDSSETSSDTTETETESSTEGTEETTTEGEETTETTGAGELPEEVISACEEACGAIDMCGFPNEGCVEVCLEVHGEYLDDPACLEAELALTECIAALPSCEEVSEFLDGESDPYPCMEIEAMAC
ncbi:hypothetical protein PPSIR1_01072 [Plesiocystis pacifica SIR-1]|uniref:Uncharacterized protein n=1 Tax=Plesiocystis pacifica SIR-1 TaxID=391625 RepID=A6GFL0_9BACT|nr:hypothetical protein [Plesiocystis pacifica]EDM75324.1 hypothetical protein PPSIR1_01072 [Plesiocystis pacifica SIR-1]